MAFKKSVLIKTRDYIIDFNHISKEISDESKKTLLEYYAYYHKLAYIYRKCFKLHRNVYIALTVTNGVLACSGIISLFTLPMVAIASALAIINTGINEGFGFKAKAEKCELAFKCFQEILDDIRSYLRGNEYNEANLIDELLIKEKVMKAPECPGIIYYNKKYNKKFNIKLI